MTTEIQRYLRDEKNSQLAKEYFSSRQENVDDGKYNIFKLISDLYYRENLHSDIIRYFLDPNENHHCGDIFLKSFFHLLGKFGISILPHNYDDAIVLREDGKIDVLIKSEKNKRAIIIENKINNAPDMPRQLPRYYDYISQSYSIDAIIYLPLDNTKTPDMCDWTEEDKNNVKPLIIIPAYDKHGLNIVDDWINPSIQAVDNIDIISTLRQYSSLVKHLKNDIIDSIIMEKFYNELLQNNNMESARAIRDMLNDLPNYMALRILKQFGANYFPFSKIILWKPNVVIIEGWNKLYLKLEIICSNDDGHYDVLFWVSNNQIEAFESLINSLKSLENFQKSSDEDWRVCYKKRFNFEKEKELFGFIESLKKELQERK